MTTHFLIEIIIGFICALGTIWFFRAKFPSKQFKAWANNLIIAAFIYVIFALVGTNWSWMPTELLGLVAYGALALLGLRYSPWLIAVGWALHVLWDLLLHPGGHPGYVPAWYPASNRW